MRAASEGPCPAALSSGPVEDLPRIRAAPREYLFARGLLLSLNLLIGSQNPNFST